MANVPSEIQTWQMVQPWKKNKETGEKVPGKLEAGNILYSQVTKLQIGQGSHVRYINGFVNQRLAFV